MSLNERFLDGCVVCGSEMGRWLRDGSMMRCVCFTCVPREAVNPHLQRECVGRGNTARVLDSVMGLGDFRHFLSSFKGHVVLVVLVGRVYVVGFEAGDVRCGDATPLVRLEVGGGRTCDVSDLAEPMRTAAMCVMYYHGYMKPLGKSDYCARVWIAVTDWTRGDVEGAEVWSVENVPGVCSVVLLGHV